MLIKLLNLSDIRLILAIYFFTFYSLIVAFVNIYAMDKREFLYNKQKCIDFKHKMFFIIQESKNKYVISKKTFVLELISYLLLIIFLGLGISSLFFDEKISLIITLINFFVSLIFCLVTSIIDRRSKKSN